MADVVEPPSWIAWWSVQRSLLLSVVGSGGLGAAMRGLPLEGDLLAGAGIVALWGLTAWTVRRVSWLFHLPLVLGDTAVRQMVLGRPALRVRAWAGHGRVFEVQQVLARWLPPGDATPQTLEVDLPRPSSFVGPLTITVFLPDLPVGEVEIEAKVVCQGELFQAHRRYGLDALVQGPLRPPVTRTPDGLDWQREHWDRAEHG